MQKFVDRAGRIWIVDIDNTTLRRVKALTGVQLLEAIDGDLITRLSTDPLLLGDVLFAICKPQADKQEITDESFGEGLAGNAIDDATGALLEALLSYFPESRRRLLRKAAEKQKLIETRGLIAIEKRLDDPNLVDRIVEDLERKLAVPTLSDSSSDFPASSESTQVPYPFIPPFDPPDEEPPYIPPDSSSSDDEANGSSSEDPGPRPPWWPEDWPWPPPPDEPVVIEAPPPLPNIIWPRLPPDHPYHLPPGYHYPDNLPEGHPGHYYPGMPPYPVVAP